MEQNFPNKEIIEIYSDDKHETCSDLRISWDSPCTDLLVDFLVYHLSWEPSSVRRRMLPILSTIFLREMAINRTENLLHGQYEFDSIQRVKLRYGHRFYVIKWKKPSCLIGCPNYPIPIEDSDSQPMQVEESVSTLESDEPEPDVSQVYLDDGCWFLLTDENMDLVQNAFPGKVNSFLQKKEAEESKRRKRSSSRSEEGAFGQSGTPSSKIVQTTVTEYYRSTKVLNPAKPADNSPCGSENPGVESLKETCSAAPSPNLPKS
ncbi:hypothetical protein Dimus_025203, partial [Dionaea muscipula]